MFFVKYFAGAVVPIKSPHYYNGRVNISLEKRFWKIKCVAEIEREKYDISKEQFDKIKKYIICNIDKLKQIALNQTKEQIDGVYNRIKIGYRLKRFSISIYNVKSQEDAMFIAEVEEKIKNMIIGD